MRPEHQPPPTVPISRQDLTPLPCRLTYYEGPKCDDPYQRVSHSRSRTEENYVTNTVEHSESYRHEVHKAEYRTNDC